MYNIVPGMNQMFAKGEWDALKETYLKTLKFKVTILFAAFWGLILYHQYIVELWVGKKQYEGFNFTIVMSIYLIVLTISNFNESVIIVYGKIKWYAKLQILVTVSGLIMTIIAGHYFHLLGIVISNLIALISVTTYAFYRLFKILDISLVLSNWFPNLRYTLFLTIISIGIFIAQHKFNVKTNLIGVIFTALVFVLLILFEGVEKEQRRDLIKVFKKI
jgi:O-antigen/teichoic acid export membrane protein